MNILAGKTPKGDEVYIVTTPLGAYRLERRGPGPRTSFEDEQFSSIFLARKAFERWTVANAKAYAKSERIDAIIETLGQKEAKKKREEATALKNGELDSVTFEKE